MFFFSPFVNNFFNIVIEDSSEIYFKARIAVIEDKKTGKAGGESDSTGNRCGL